jgi:uncharacterized membrane protein HdeD (DUF308 family)
MSNIGFIDLRDRFQAGIEEIRHKWGWYLALGVVLIALGVAAVSYAFYTTVASVFLLGWILLASGITLSIMSFLTGRWSGFLLSLATGILSIITGVLLLRAPLSSAAVLTLLIASFLLVGGIFRIISAAVMRFPNWGWAVLSGITALFLGGVLYAGWPTISLWFLGFYVGIDLMVHGFSWSMFALSIRNLPRISEREREHPAA